LLTKNLQNVTGFSGKLLYERSNCCEGGVVFLYTEMLTNCSCTLLLYGYGQFVNLYSNILHAMKVNQNNADISIPLQK